MAELLVCLVDINERVEHHRAGDVITIQQDGHPWGKEELCAINWRVVSVPGAVSLFGDLVRTEHQQRHMDNSKDPLAEFEINPRAAMRSHRLNVAKLGTLTVGIVNKLDRAKVVDAKFRALHATNERIIG